MTPKNKPVISFSIDRLLDPSYSSTKSTTTINKTENTVGEDRVEGENLEGVEEEEEDLQVLETQSEQSSDKDGEYDDCFIDDKLERVNYLRGNEAVPRSLSPVRPTLIHKNVYKDSRTVTSPYYHHSHHPMHRHTHINGMPPNMSGTFNLTDRLAGMRFLRYYIYSRHYSMQRRK